MFVWGFLVAEASVRLSVFPGGSGLVLELLRFAIAPSFALVIALHFSDRIVVGDSGMLRSSLFSNNLSSFVFLACGQLRFKWVTWCLSLKKISMTKLSTRKLSKKKLSKKKLKRLIKYKTVFRGCEPRNVEKRISLDEVSIVSEDRLNRGHLAPGRGRPAPRSPRPWTRTIRAEVTSPMDEDDPRRGHLAHGQGRPAPRSPRPWARTTRTEVTSPMSEDRPPIPKPCILV
ncbi:hypothetical protein HID58_053069 [Brassica napus]|uniref:Uncharacterized protein n=1 Tax=Brassica napus TaxID=3708 RepID=A0ABQ8ADN3_BRANA|nr:hypothetical protein HID58_053069 [Brassica napus]